MAEGTLARAWQAWLEYSAASVQHREQLQTAVQHWTARELAAAFNRFRCLASTLHHYSLAAGFHHPYLEHLSWR